MSELSKRILLDELIEQGHPEAVEDVIFYALHSYAKHNKQTWNGTIANAIVSRIEDVEKEDRPIFMNPEKITEAFDL